MSNIDFANETFGLHISEELDALRNSLCPAPGRYLCPPSCPIWAKYGAQGLSCNGALDKYPEDCRLLLQGINKKKTVVDECSSAHPFQASKCIDVLAIPMPDISAIKTDYNGAKSFLANARCLTNTEKHKLDEYLYCIEWFFEGKTLEDYFTAFKFAKQIGFDTFVDIGCASAHQSELFRGSDIQYVGIESCPGLLWRPEDSTYIIERYPCHIPIDVLHRKVLGASRLCVGYLTSDYEAIARQFDDFLLSGPPLACHGLASLYKESFKVCDPDNKECGDRWTWFHGSVLKV